MITLLSLPHISNGEGQVINKEEMNIFTRNTATLTFNSYGKTQRSMNQKLFLNHSR